MSYLGNIAGGGFAITADDDNDLSVQAAGIYVGGAGNIVAVLADNTTVTFTGVQAGSTIPWVFKRILTGTTATGLIGGTP